MVYCNLCLPFQFMICNSTDSRLPFVTAEYTELLWQSGLPS